MSSASSNGADVNCEKNLGIVKEGAALIEKYTLWTSHTLDPDEILPDDENRDELDIVAMDAVKTVETIHEAGFVLSKLRQVCVQFPKSGTGVDDFLQKHRKVALLDEALPRVVDGKPAYKGLAGNHNNTFHRMCKQERPCKAFCSVQRDGTWFLSLAKLAELEPERHAIVTKGSPWIVLSRTMLEEEPRAASIIQRSENLINACSKLPGFLEGISRACNFLDFMSESEAVRMLGKEMPNLIADAEAMVHLASKLGGKSSRYLQLWLFLSNHFVARNRALPKSTAVVISDLSLAVPWFKICLLWAAQNCPSQFVDNDVCKWVSKGDVVAMRGRDGFKALSQMANDALDEAGKCVHKRSATEDVQRFAGLLAKIGRFALNKKHAAFDDHESLAQILAMYKEEKADAKGGATPGGGKTPGGDASLGGVETHRGMAVKAMKEKSVVAYDADGKLTDEAALLKEAGLEKGVYVKGMWFEDPSAADNGVAVTAWVHALRDHHVEVTLVGQKHKKKQIILSYEEYQKHWTLQYDKEAVIDRGIVSDWSHCQMHKKKEWIDHAAKAKVTSGLVSLSKCLWQGKEPSLRLESKPVKKVFVEASYDVGEVILVPLSTNLCVDKVTPENVASKLQTSVLGSEGNPVWICAAPTILPKPGSKNENASMEVFWCVRKIAETDKGDASGTLNMEIAHFGILGALAVRIVNGTSVQALHIEAHGSQVLCHEQHMYGNLTYVFFFPHTLQLFRTRHPLSTF